MRLVADVRFAFRTLRKSPSFAVIAVTSLALGIGANTAIFSWVDAVLLRPLPVPHSGDIIAVNSSSPGNSFGAIWYPDYVALRDRSRSLESLVCYNFFPGGVSTDPKELPRYNLNAIVSGNFFTGLGVPIVAGRAFSPDEDNVPGRDLVTVISYRMWDREFAKDPSAIGRRIRLNGADFTVIGVAGEKFTGPEAYVLPDVYVPMQAFAQAIPGSEKDYLTGRGKSAVNVLGRMKPGIRISKAQAELATIAATLQSEFPATNKDRTVKVLSYLRARFVNNQIDATLSLTLLGLTGLVLLIACANVANLLLARGAARAKELAIRMAVGAQRGTLVRQLLTESLIIALAGGIAGMGVGYAGVVFLASIPIPSDFPIALGFEMNNRLLAFGFVCSIATGVIFGLVPAFRATRGDVASSIKTGDSGPARMSFFRGVFSGRHILVIAQLALSVILLVVSGACIRGFQAAQRIHPGFRMDHTLFFSVDTRTVRYDEARSRDFRKQLAGRLRDIGGVRDVAMSSSIQFSTAQSMRKFLAEGEQKPRSEDIPDAWSYRVDDHFFGLMQARILRGRAIDATDTATSPKVAVVNENLAKRLFPNQDPIGKRFRLDSPEGPLVEIVGIVKNGVYMYWAEPPQYAMWTPYSQDFSSQVYFELRTAGDPASYAAAVREGVRTLDANLPILRLSTLETFFEQRAMLGPRLIAQVVTAAGLMGLFMAVIGLYGVVAYGVTRRTREIGIRMAIGATPRLIVRMVLRQGVMFTIIGLLIGMAVVVPIATYILPNFVVGTSPLAPPILAAVLVILAGAMMIACWIPARRAARIDPTHAVRQE